MRDIPAPVSIRDMPFRHTAEGAWITLGVNLNQPDDARIPNDWKGVTAKTKRRKDWEAEAAAGGRWNPTNLMERISQCSYCEILIGRGYFMNEVYLYPTGFKRVPSPANPKKMVERPKWGHVCEYCAVSEELNLPFGFCLVCHDDYSGVFSDTLTTFSLTPRIVLPKEQSLNDALLPLWNEYAREERRKYLALHSSLEGFRRLRTLQQFCSTVKPPRLTYTDIMSQLGATNAA